MDRAAMRSRVAAAPVGHLATVTAAGRPHLVPVCFALAGETLVHAVDGKPKSTSALARLAHMRANPSVSVLVDHYDDDWSALWWVRIDGTARIVPDGADHQAAVDALSAKYAQYREHPPTGPAILITAHSWRAWSAS